MGLAFGVTAYTVIFFAAPLAVKLLGAPDLIWPLRVMSIAILMTSTTTVPVALMERELAFQKRALPEMALGATHVVVAITLALLGYGVWSLIMGYVIATAVLVVWTWKITDWRPSLSFALDSARQVLAFGRPLMASSILLFGFFYIDQASIGRWLGIAAVGCYNLAFTMCHLPATNITFVVNRVMYPTYSKLNHDIPAVRKVYDQTVRSISLISIPIAIWMCLMSHDIVTGFFGNKWLSAIPLVRILAFYGMFRSIAATADSVFMATGNTKWSFRISCIQIAIALPLVYPVATHYGTAGVAFLFTMAYSIGGMTALYRVTHLLKHPKRNLAGLFIFPFFASVVVISASFGVSRLFHPGLAATISSLALTVPLYLLAVLRYDRESVSTLRSVLGSLKRQPEPA
jgi:O-antigen/teichoic acid export membrane protein